MENTDKNFIAVNIITLSKEKKAEAKKETIRISDIKSFREWNKKGPEDEGIEGPVTLLNMQNDDKGRGDKIKIAESEISFTQRLGGRVININE